MASIATLRVQVEVISNEGALAQSYESVTRWSPVGNGNRSRYSIDAATFQALTIPTGTKYLVILPGDATSLTLKGITGDAGCTITPTSAPLEGPVILSLGASPALGILNGAASAQTLEVITL